MHSSRMCTARMLPYVGLPNRDPLDTDTPGHRPPWTQTPMYRDPPGQRPSPGQRPPWAETPRQRHPQTETLTDRDPLDRDPLNRYPPSTGIPPP